jgi:hypothetical protein
MEMARQTNKGKARQVSSKTQSLTEIFGEVLSKTRSGLVNHCKARQGLAIPQLRTVHGSIWNCHTFVVPLYR